MANMKSMWICFVVCFFHQIMLTKCESTIISSETKSTETQDAEDREQVHKESEEILFKEFDNDMDVENMKLYSKESGGGVGEKLSMIDENREYYNKMGPLDKEQYRMEKLAGDPADTFGTNQHHYYPTEYKDLGRRFVLQYPYHEVNADKNSLKDEVEAESVLDNVGKKSKKQAYTKEDLKLLPVKAAPELVLRVAIQSAMEQANQPQDSNDVKEKDILRSGDYWDSVRVEEVNPKTVLRSFQEKTGYKLGDEKQNRKPKLNSLKAKIMPGSKLYELVSVLKKSSPRLLYVINDN